MSVHEVVTLSYIKVTKMVNSAHLQNCSDMKLFLTRRAETDMKGLSRECAPKIRSNSSAALPFIVEIVFNKIYATSPTLEILRNSVAKHIGAQKAATLQEHQQSCGGLVDAEMRKRLVVKTWMKILA